MCFSCTKQHFGICSNLLGRNSDHVAPTNIHFETPFDNRSLDYSSFTLKLILEQTQSPPACYEYVIHLLCLLVAPPCNSNTSTPMPLCLETCRAYDRLISTGLCDNFISGIAEHFEGSSFEFREILPYFNAFNCSKPSTCGSSLSPCTNLFSFETQGISVCLLIKLILKSCAFI